jgi:hypothetical protein
LTVVLVLAQVSTGATFRKVMCGGRLTERCHQERSCQ